MPAMKIGDLLTPHRRRFTGLQQLLDQADRQNAWTLELQAVLPDTLSGACRVIDIRGDTLVVVCSDGAAATRMRFEAANIIRRLKVLHHYQRVTRLKARVSRTGDSSST